MCRRGALEDDGGCRCAGVAQKASLSFWDAMESLMTNPESSRAVAPLRAFRELIQRLQDGYAKKEPVDYLRYVLDETRVYERAEGPEHAGRLWRGLKTWKS